MVLWILQLLLGGFITTAGIGKLLDIKGFESIIDSYELGLSERARWIIAILVISFELITGATILIGQSLHLAAFGSLVMHFGYFILLSSSLMRRLKLKNCGCFGVFFPRPLTWYSPLEDLALMGLSYWLFILT